MRRKSGIPEVYSRILSRGGREIIKKLFILPFVCCLVVMFTANCKPKAKTAPAPPPPAKEQPKVEKVDEAPAVKKPEMTEEERFMTKPLEEERRVGKEWRS